ncbi:MAG TPA: hypothetical protein VN690_12715 [Terriglobales bacterium]|nr:hypothetical protein [Terriglobales bacterium]
MKSRLLLCFLALALASAAQSLDLAAGLGGVASGNGVGGSYWPSFDATAMFSRYIGLNADFAFRANEELASLARTKFATFNLAFRPAPRLVTPELDLGFAAERFAAAKCDNCIVNPNGPPIHIPTQRFYGAHLGVAAIVHLSGRWFLRPSYHLYVGKQMHHPSRFAIEVGYTFGRLWK